LARRDRREMISVPATFKSGCLVEVLLAERSHPETSHRNY
jgi:hypothetical protein